MIFSTFQSSLRARVLGLGLLFAVALAACSSDLPESGVAVESADTDSTEVEADEPADTADQNDASESGETESEPTDTEDDEGDEEVEVDPDWLGGTKSRTAAVQLARGMLQPCGPTGFSMESAIADAPGTVRRQLEQVEAKVRRIRQACNSSEETFNDAVREAIDEVADFVEANANGAPVLSGDGLSGADLATETVLAYEWASWAMDGIGLKSHSNALWLNNAHRGHTLAMLEPPAEEEVQATGGVVITGSTQALHGLVPSVIGGDLPAQNAAVPGIVTSFGLWMDDVVVPNVEPETVVIGISVAEVMGAPDRECPQATGDRLKNALTRGVDIFADAPEIDGYNFSDLLASEAGKRLDLAPLANVFARSYVGEGDFVDYPELSDDALASRAESRLAAFEAWNICDGYIDHLGESIASLTGAGIEVLVVLMPMQSELRDAAGGEGENGGLDEVADAIIAAAGDASILDLTAEVPDDQFLDLSTLNQAGAATVSQAVSAVLG